MLFFFYFFIGNIYADEWNEPLDRADLLLFSSHSDDEHLFFGGILPYCVANGIKAQVVYITNHNDNPPRNTELLNGLWEVGIRNAPVISRFPDLFSETLPDALRVYKNRGFSEEDFTGFFVENIRRFKPQVAVGHDVNGEYGHGTHMLNAVVLMKAVELAADSNYHAESFAKYGIWDTPKTYINLWKERPIVLSIDEPLSFFDGKTAFQVSQDGFKHHKSQHWTWFYKWLYGTEQSPVTKSTQIRSYTPGNFGLFRTLVGDDSQNAGDFFENTLLIKDIAEEPAAADEADLDLTSEFYLYNDNIIEPGNYENEKLYKKIIIPVIVIALAVVFLLLFLIKKTKRN